MLLKSTLWYLDYSSKKVSISFFVDKYWLCLFIELTGWNKCISVNVRIVMACVKYKISDPWYISIHAQKFTKSPPDIFKFCLSLISITYQNILSITKYNYFKIQPDLLMHVWGTRCRKVQNKNGNNSHEQYILRHSHIHNSLSLSSSGIKGVKNSTGLEI